MALHKDLTGTDLHEMKGAAGAAADTVPVATGAGSTTFKKIGRASFDLSSVPDPLVGNISAVIPDMSASDPVFFCFPRSVILKNIYVVNGDTYSSGSNPTLTLTRMADTASIFAGSIDLINEAAGTMESANISAINATIGAGGVVRIVSSAASASTPLFITVTFEYVI